MKPKQFWVQQGMFDPRERTWGYRHWSEHEKLPLAIKSAKELGHSRILEVRELREYDNGNRTDNKD